MGLRSFLKARFWQLAQPVFSHLKELHRPITVFDFCLFELAKMSEAEDAVRRRTAVAEYRKKLLQHKELESRVKSVRESLRASKKEFNKTEEFNIDTLALLNQNSDDLRTCFTVLG
ncbi:hypothetical protein Vadar_026392 [Vaccinium darrowii]|uniref:Uncharacterized protein n=1 Tax=Vaccinium darrowii TaxID=229202 RepID=A0ACB7Y3G6_9ERIC|nr:hypothetical protein Vadar_026392 [Vaccinium darrowii]